VEGDIPNRPGEISMITKRRITELSLIIILRLSGLMLITAFIAVFLPYENMASIHSQMGLGKLPPLPILDYLARSVSMFYSIHGVIVLYISFNLMRYLPFLKLLCYLGFIFGIALFIIDIKAQMPANWSLVEGPFIVLLNMVIYVLIKMLEREISNSST
jgi:hypothetical protein